MDCKGVSVFLGRLYTELLCFLVPGSILLHDWFCRMICWDLMTGGDGRINEGRHVFGALKLFAK
jgi:hypothetical protein